MVIHHLYGPSAPELGWVPAPSYLLRRHRIMHILDKVEPCDTLEVGCGAGALLYELAEKGFRCTALETSAAALDIANKIHADSGVSIVNEPNDQWRGRFDYVLAFEVLEHIEDDKMALAQWFQWLKPGGKLLLSVPAQMRYWTASDEWAGHYRRYEREELESLVVDCGYTIGHLEAYGSPLANVIDPIRARVHARQMSRRRHEGIHGKAVGSSLSGVERPVETRLFPYLCSIPGVLLMRGSFFAQGILGSFGIGKGYMILATKS